MSDEASTFAALYVERCRIRNFRGLRDCELEFEPSVTLLVGRNNAGKTRVLRAIAIALGAQVEIDDLTLGSTADATIDLVIAPTAPKTLDADDAFEPAIAQRLGMSISITRDEPIQERFGWRTTIRRSAEGLGARSEATVMAFDTERREWTVPSSPTPLSRDQRTLLAFEMIATQRDLAEDFSRRNSAIRRVLSNLEVDADARAELETELAALGSRIISESEALGALKSSLDQLQTHVSGLGSVALTPIPVRLEEMSRSVAIDLDSGSGATPLRLQGSGARSLASLQVQSVHYERRLGMDGPSIRPHPITLVEEPESHLHPQAEVSLGKMLDGLPGQVIASTHSSHLVAAVDQRCIRLLRQHAGATAVIDLGPVDQPDQSTHRALRPDTHVAEMEKLKRLVERPFGELLFASAIVIGDGATERAFLPAIVRHALPEFADGVCVIDPGNLGNETAHAAIKFARLVGVPWILFSDSDAAGAGDAKTLVDTYADGDTSNTVFISGNDTGAKGAAIERMLIDFDADLCAATCHSVRPGMSPSSPPFDLMKSMKGSIGGPLSYAFVQGYPDPATWPAPLRELISVIRRSLQTEDPE